MSTIQEQLVLQLASVATLHPMVVPQGTVSPYVTYQRISNGVNNVLYGPPSIDNTRIQIDVWAATYSGAAALAQAIKTKMLAWSVQNVLLGDYDLYEPTTKEFRVLLEFSIWQ